MKKLTTLAIGLMMFGCTIHQNEVSLDGTAGGSDANPGVVVNAIVVKDSSLKTRKDFDSNGAVDLGEIKEWLGTLFSPDKVIPAIVPAPKEPEPAKPVEIKPEPAKPVTKTTLKFSSLYDGEYPVYRCEGALKVGQVVTFRIGPLQKTVTCIKRANGSIGWEGGGIVLKTTQAEGRTGLGLMLPKEYAGKTYPADERWIQL